MLSVLSIFLLLLLARHFLASTFPPHPHFSNLHKFCKPRKKDELPGCLLLNKMHFLENFCKKFGQSHHTLHGVQKREERIPFQGPHMSVAPHKSRKLRRGQFSCSFIAFSGKVEENAWLGKAIKFRFSQSFSDITQVFQALEFAIEVKFMWPRRKRNFPFLQKIDFSVSFPS